jgi:predicted RNA-binding Zn-ribbon protein involved in translation (DUF1610 family)
MKRYRFFRVFTVLGVIALSFFSFALTTQAMGTATVGTTLTFQPPTPVSVGNAAIIVVQLISSKGEPVADQPVELLVNGEHERRARTDGDGNISVNVRRAEAGTYALSAVFKGSKLPSLGSSRASADLVVTPALIEVHVTPPLPNIKFALDNQVFASDDYGVARVEVGKAGKYRLELLPLETNNPDIQMAFGRWGDDYFVPSRDIEIPLRKPLDVGLEVSYQAGQTFVDLKGKPVDRSRITSITLKGSNGATYTFEDTLPHWIPAGRIIRLNNGLQETKILYSVISVVIDGSNVVSQAQQRFYVHQNDIWTVKLLLYTAKFTAHDALFRFPLGTGIRMEYPDGDVQTFDFRSNQGNTITGLARGIYRVTVTGAEGFAPATPIALSRNQDVDLMVFSYMDMGVLAGIGVIVALGLLFFGRPHLMRQTVTFPARTVSEIRKFRPAQAKEFYGKISAVGTGIVSKKGHVRLENKSNAASLDLPTYAGIEIVNSVGLDQAETEEVVLADEIAAPILSDPSDEGTNPRQEPVSDVMVEQDEAGIILSQPETSSAASEEVQPSVETKDNGPVSVAAETASPTQEASPAAQAEAALTCHVCGSSQLVKKETKRPSQQRYECQVCGATNNFGAKRTRKRRQKNRVESIVS